MNELFELIKILAQREQKTIEQMGLKLAEKTGECTQAILSAVNAKGCEYKELTFDDVKEECVDVILVASSLFFQLNGSLDEIKETLNKKAKKWEEKSLQ